MQNIDMDGFMSLFGWLLGYLTSHGFTMSFIGLTLDFTYLEIMIGAMVIIIGIEVLHRIFDW